MNTNGTPYLILNSVYGWHEQPPAEARDGLAFTADGNRQLFALPGRSSLALSARLQSEHFRCLSALSVRNKVALVDATTNQVSLLDLSRVAIEHFSTFGGQGSGTRNFRGPRGVAVLKSGAIVVSDTGNHRIQIYSHTQDALVQSWGAVDAMGQPMAGDGPKEFRFPWAVVADDCETIFVVDRGNRRIQKISRDGRWLAYIGGESLVDPTRIALGPNGLVAVVDPAQQAVLIFSPRRTHPRAITNIEGVRSLTFSSDGTLFVADAQGRIEVYVPDTDPERKDKYNSIGQGHSGVDGEILDLAWVAGKTPYLLAIIKENFDGLRQRLWRVEPLGTFKHEGWLITSAIDSRIEKCQWHRILLNASIPSGQNEQSKNASKNGELGAGNIEIESYTSDDAHIPGWTPAEQNWTRSLLSGDSNPDCLVQSGPGRFLWLRITLRSNGIATPVINGINAFFPRSSYLKYLPAVFQEDTESRLFLEKFLSIFQTEFDYFDQQIDRMWQLFDPLSVTEANFDWLAGWLALVVQPDSLVNQRNLSCPTEDKCEPPPECPQPDEALPVDNTKPDLSWSWEKKRQMLKDAFGTYGRRGTAGGIEQAIKDYAGVHFAKILEHFRLRRWPVLSVIGGDQPTQDPCATTPPPEIGSCGEQIEQYKVTLPLDGTVRLWSRDFYKRLQLTSYSQIGSFRLTGTPEPVLEPFDWGAHRFTVFFPASPYHIEETMQKVGQVVDREKPAHTQAELCAVLPRLRVGVQATIGADAMVGGISHLVLNSLSTLNYDSILGCAREEQELRNVAMALRPRTGTTARLA